MPQCSTLTIIGLGKVGSTFAYVASRHPSYNVVIGSRDVAKAKKQIKHIGENIDVEDTQTAASMGDIVLLTVPDDTIQSTCQHLAAEQAFKPGAIVAHCSGALSSDELLSARTSCKAEIASLHPLQTFPSFEDAIHRLSDSDCYYEVGDETEEIAREGRKSRESIEQLITHLGMRPIEIQKQAKVLYHAAAVVACNYLSALMDSALEIGEAAGIERTTLWPSLEPLVRSTLANISNHGTQGALTGPVARGDVKTVQQHKHALTALPPEQAARLSQLYSALGTQTTKLAKQKGSLSAQVEEVLQQTFAWANNTADLTCGEAIHNSKQE